MLVTMGGSHCSAPKDTPLDITLEATQSQKHRWPEQSVPRGRKRYLVIAPKRSTDRSLGAFSPLMAAASKTQGSPP